MSDMGQRLSCFLIKHDVWCLVWYYLYYSISLGLAIKLGSFVEEVFALSGHS